MVASKYRGVSWHKSKKWQSRCTVAGKSKFLGYFTDEDDAARAYNEIAVEEGKKINIISADESECGVQYRLTEPVKEKKGKLTCWSKFRGVTWDGKINRWRAQGQSAVVYKGYPVSQNCYFMLNCDADCRYVNLLLFRGNMCFWAISNWRKRLRNDTMSMSTPSI